MQKRIFACGLGNPGLPDFASYKAKNRTFLFLFNGLVHCGKVGPLLDNSLKPGLRPALAITRPITRKDGR